MIHENKNTLILGLGYVGLTLGTVMSENGHNIFGIDVNKYIVEHVKKGKSHFFEKGINKKISSSINKTLFVSESIDDFVHINFSSIIITVGTPLLNNHEPNYKFLIDAIETIKKVYNGSQLIILRSTVSVGTTRNIVIPILSKHLNINDNEVLISFCPERTVEGKALEELKELPQLFQVIIKTLLINQENYLVISTKILLKHNLWSQQR